MTIKLSQLMLNLYVVSRAGSFLRHAVHILPLCEYYDLYAANTGSGFDPCFHQISLVSFLRSNLLSVCAFTEGINPYYFVRGINRGPKDFH